MSDSRLPLILWYSVVAVYLTHVTVTSVPVNTSKQQRSVNKPGDPVWSHGESYAFATASGEGSVLETDSWSSVDNHGGLQVNNVTSNGTVIGYQVLGQTNCSQESWAFASGAWMANAIAFGLCNSSVLLDQPVSNTGVGKETPVEELKPLN